MLGRNLTVAPSSKNEICSEQTRLRPGATNVTMRADPRLHSIVFGLRVSADDDCPTSVVLGDSRQQLRVAVQRIWLFAVDCEIHQRRSRHRAFALAPKFF